MQYEPSSLLHLPIMSNSIMSMHVEQQATGYHATTVQILTFRLVTLKVAHQFDVLFDVFKAFQFPTVVNDFHWVLKNLRRGWRRQWREKGNPDSDSASPSKTD